MDGLHATTPPPTPPRRPSGRYRVGGMWRVGGGPPPPGSNFFYSRVMTEEVIALNFFQRSVWRVFYCSGGRASLCEDVSLLAALFFNCNADRTPPPSTPTPPPCTRLPLPTLLPLSQSLLVWSPSGLVSVPPSPSLRLRPSVPQPDVALLLSPDKQNDFNKQHFS